MTRAAAFGSCDQALRARDVARRAQGRRRQAARARFGLCLCGAPLSHHFDIDNQKLDCFDRAVLDARLRRVLGEIVVEVSR